MSSYRTGRDPRPAKRKAYPIPINERRNAWDREIREMGLKGFYASTIQAHVNEVYGFNFTISQIRGRLTAMGVSTVAYREGNGSWAQRAALQCRARVLRLRSLQRDVNDYVKALRSGEVGR